MWRVGSGGTCGHNGGMGYIATLTRPSAFAPGAAADESGTLPSDGRAGVRAWVQPIPLTAQYRESVSIRVHPWFSLV